MVLLYTSVKHHQCLSRIDIREYLKVILQVYLGLR